MAIDFTEVAANADFGAPGARKSGRNPAWPYCPTLTVAGKTRQLLGLAYATRDEAVAKAEMHIAAARKDLARRLAEPRMRALREAYGLPRELES